MPWSCHDTGGDWHGDWHRGQRARGPPTVVSFLYGFEPSDPATFIVAALVLMMVAATAGWLPARRASRFDPAAAGAET